MSVTNLDKNDQHKEYFGKGNQIITYEREPTTWIEIREDKLPGRIGNQDIIKVFQYREISNQGYSNDVTVIEESIIQETDISTTATQTDYLIDIQRYSKEVIKPYFLNYLDIEEKRSEESAVKYNQEGSEELSKGSKDDNDISVESSISKVDAETNVTPKSSNLHLQIEKNLNHKIKNNTNKDIIKPTCTESILQKDNSRKLCPLVHDIIKLPKSIYATETQNNTCDSQKSSSNCADFIQSLVLDRVHIKEVSIPVNMSEQSDENQSEGASGTFPSPLNCCGERRKSCDDGKDEVNIICRKGDVKFKLRCKKIDGTTAQCDKVGNEVRYECEIVPQPNQCIDKSILESCDLKCSLVNSSDPNSIIPHNIKNDRVGPFADKPPSPPSESQPPSPQQRSPPQSSSPASSSINPGPENNDNPKVKMLVTLGESPCNSQHSMLDGNQIDDDVIKLEECTSEKQIFACRSKNKINDSDNTIKEELQVNCVKNNVVQNNKSSCQKEPGIFDDIATAISSAHCKTMATLRVAADDILTNVSKAVSKTTDCSEETSATLNKIKSSATDIVSELQKKVKEVEIKETVNTAIKTGCQTIKSVSKSTRMALEEATRQTKSVLGYKQSDDNDDECNKCKSPCKSRCKKTACSIDINENNTEYTESVRASVEKFYDNVCKTTRDATDAFTDYASQNINILKTTTDDKDKSPQSEKSEQQIAPRGSVTQLLFKALNKMKEVENVPDDNRLKGLKSSAENIMQKLSIATGKIAEATEKIAECTQEACSEIAEHSKQLFKPNKEGNELQRKKENIKAILSGFHFFQNNDTKTDSKKEEKTIGSFHSLKSSFASLGHIVIKEESSSYDKPTPPKEVALVDSGIKTRTPSMFTNIKDRIIAIFYDKEKQDLDSDSSADKSETDTE